MSCCYLASAYITNIIWLIRITNLCSSKRDGENAKISEPKTTKQTFVSRCTWASYEAFWKVRPWFRKQWQTQWSISTMRKTLSIRESHEGFRARELRGSKDDLCNACRLSIIGQVSQQANSGREWEINYTWLILQVNFCCLWVIFFFYKPWGGRPSLAWLACQGQSFVLYLLGIMCFEACYLAWMLSHAVVTSLLYPVLQSNPAIRAPAKIRTPHFLRAACFVPEKRKPLHFL